MGGVTLNKIIIIIDSFNKIIINIDTNNFVKHRIINNIQINSRYKCGKTGVSMLRSFAPRGIPVSRFGLV